MIYSRLINNDIYVLRYDKEHDYYFITKNDLVISQFYKFYIVDPLEVALTYIKSL